MNTLRMDADNVELAKHFCFNVAQICIDPLDTDTMAELEVQNIRIGKLLMTDPVTLIDVIRCTRNRIGSDDNYPLESLRNNGRAALMAFSKYVVDSRNISAKDIPGMYDAISNGMDLMGRNDAAFTRFGLRCIRRDLIGDFVIRRGNPEQQDHVRTNILAAWETIGYPYGLLGKVYSRLIW